MARSAIAIVTRAERAPCRDLSGDRMPGAQDLAPDPGVGIGPVDFLDIRVVFVFREVGDDVRDALGEPSAMAWRAAPVGQAVPETDRSGDGAEIKAPWTEGRGPVVPPAVITMGPTVPESRTRE